jgi:dephospho-CoA kinase
MLVVGLTGGIASGKSVVAAMFKELGARVIDADRISREVMVPHTECWEKVLHHFGKAILASNLTINRKKLASEIFADSEKRSVLNRIVHPFIQKRIDEMLSRIRSFDPGALVVIDAALLVETGQYKCYDKLVVVATEEKTQLSRLVSRDKLSREEALRRARAQLPLAEKKKVADYVINNGGSLGETRKQTEELFHALCALRSAKTIRCG